MKKKKMINTLCAYSILYMIATLINSILYLSNGIYEDPGGNWHELDRAIILLIGMVAFELCTKLTIKPMILRYIAAYIPSQLLAFGYVWFRGLRDELASSAYRDIWINFTIFFVLFSIINIVISLYKNKKNR